jgi:hypothetical protein
LQTAIEGATDLCVVEALLETSLLPKRHANCRSANMFGARVMFRSVFFSLLWKEVAGLQIPLVQDSVEPAPLSTDASDRPGRKLHGRFLQVTGMSSTDIAWLQNCGS